MPTRDYSGVTESYRNQMAIRIDRCLRTLSDNLSQKEGVKLTDKQVNARVAAAIGVSEEAVRQWRKAVTAPRRQQLESLVKYLQECGVHTTPEYLERGLTKGLPPMELRERIADEGEELELLRLFRASNLDGKQTILNNARAIQLSFPQGHNVKSLHQHKKKPRR